MSTLRRRYDVRDRVVFITGGARGIGAAAARRLVERGAHVALVDVDAAEVQRRAAELGERAAWFEADVTDVEAIEATVAATAERFGGIDVVLANAGISGVPRTVAAADPADFERVIEVNLLGVWRTVRAALPYVVERRGYVLPIASIAAVVPVPLLGAYGASKAAVESLARTLRMELAHTGTGVGVGYFSFIQTDMMLKAVADPVAAQALKAIPAFLARPLPVDAAGAAIVNGIERRAKRVYAPRWVPALLAARSLVAATDGLVARDPRLIKACRMAKPSAEPAEAAAPLPRSRRVA